MVACAHFRLLIGCDDLSCCLHCLHCLHSSGISSSYSFISIKQQSFLIQLITLMTPTRHRSTSISICRNCIYCHAFTTGQKSQTNNSNGKLECIRCRGVYLIDRKRDSATRVGMPIPPKVLGCIHLTIMRVGAVNWKSPSMHVERSTTGQT